MTRFGKDTTRGGVRPSTLRRPTIAGLIVVSVLNAGAPAWSASLPSANEIGNRIKSTFERVTNQRSAAAEQSDLARFLKAGPNYWSVTAPYDLPAGLKVAKNSDGSLQDTPLNRYLVWKRDQAPAFFDKRHPKLAPAMQINDQLRAQAQILAVSRLLTQQAQQLAPKTAAMQVLTPPNHAAQTLEPGSTSGTTSCPCSACTGGAANGGTASNPQPQIGPAPAPVPEPASIASTLVVFGAAGWWSRRRRVGRSAA